MSRLSSGEPGTTAAPLVAARPQPGRVDEGQPGLDAFGVRAVALVAALGEHRADLRFEVLEVLGRELLRPRRQGDGGGQREDGYQEANPDRRVSMRLRPRLLVHD